MCALVVACSQPVSSSPHELRPESQVVSWQASVKESLSPVLETSGAVVAGVESELDPTTDEEWTIIAVDLPLTATLVERDAYRAISAVDAADRRGRVDVVFTRVKADGTTKITIFSWSPDGTMSRLEGAGVRRGGSASADYVGRAKGVLADMIKPIANGDRPVPKLEPMPPAVD